jgi:hypothetical protein
VARLLTEGAGKDNVTLFIRAVFRSHRCIKC